MCLYISYSTYLRYSATHQLDNAGNVNVSFTMPLPTAIEDSVSSGTLTFVVTDGGTVETFSKTIPVAHNDIVVCLCALLFLIFLIAVNI